MAKRGLNCLFLKRLWLVFSTMSRPPSHAFFLLLLIIPASVVEQVAIYYVGLLPSGFYLVLESRDVEGFYRQLWVSWWWVVAIVLIKSSKSYAAGALYIQWRWNLTETLHSKYFANKLYYDLNCLNNGIDNPDMRITQDVDKLTDALQAIILQVVVFPGIVTYYTYKCWSTMGYLGPVCIYSYFIVACVCNKILMSPIVSEVFQLERKEGHFRYIHVNLRTSAESAAFSDAESAEKRNFKETLQSILQSKQRIVTKQLLLNFAVNTCDYVGATLSYMILAIPIFNGVYDGVEHLGTVISQNSFIAMYLVYSFSSMIDLSGKVADLAGYTHRVGELLEFMQAYSDNLIFGNKQSGRDSSDDEMLDENLYDGMTKTVEEEPHKALLRLTAVTVLNPITNKSLIKNLSLSLNRHNNVLIQGPPGAGKSSILRTIKGLWEPLTGSIESIRDIVFLPQRPYFSQLSLAAQMTLPDTPDTADETLLLGILEKLHLTSILHDTLFVESEKVKKSRIARLLTKSKYHLQDESKNELNINRDTSNLNKITPSTNHPTSPLDRLPQRDWYKTLSPGKQQLLAFARVLYHKPQIVIMDEATSAVSTEYVELIYGLLQEMGVCYLSVSHDETLERFHDKVIVIAGDGENWSYKSGRECRIRGG